jgi:uncharacterized damage-inducible protein DinB
MTAPEAIVVTSAAYSFLAEFEAQAPITRLYLERLPEDKLTWKPHEKSMTAGQLALHIASWPGYVVHFVANNPVQVRSETAYPQPTSRGDILKAFDDSIVSVRETLPSYDDAAMQEQWRLVAGDHEVLSTSRGAFLRDVMFSHMYQHRGQFSVYLRLLGIAVPASWGPSADELPSFMKNAETGSGEALQGPALV